MNPRKLLAVAMMGLALGLAVLSAAADDKPAIKEKSDADFAKKASACGLAEVNFSELALRLSRTPTVKQFAEHMLADHKRANRELTQMANRLSLKMATGMDDEHQKLYDKLKTLNGAEFDQKFMEAMVKDHEKAVKLFETQSKEGKDDSMKEWAGKLAPILKRHLEKAREVCKEVKGDK